MESSFFQTLTSATEEAHQRTLNHPTVLAIGEGTLPEETFRYYIEQDYQFLTRYVKVMAHGVIASHDLDTTTRLAELLRNTFAIEMDALRDLYRQFAGDPDALSSVPRSPTCAAYTNHLLATASERDLLLILASILPCQWGYREIGCRLKERGLPADERYAAWINEYADPDYGVFVGWLIELLDRLAQDAAPDRLACATETFILSAEYEHRFWGMAWNQEQW